jgi:hypothetical protein
MGGSGLRCLRRGPSPSLYEWRDATRLRFHWFADDVADHEALGWRTDATFVLLMTDASGGVESITLADATHLETHGRTIVRSPRRIEFLEWQRGDAPPQVPEWHPETATAPQPA